MEVQDPTELMPSLEGFSKAFSNQRAKAKLSRAQLAVFAGIGMGALERVEQMKQLPTLKTLVCICAVFEMSVDEMLDLAYELS